MKSEISIDLKSSSSANIITILTISTLFLLFIIWFIISKGLVMFNGEETSIRELFSYIVLSTLGITIPTVLNVALTKTLILNDAFLVDYDRKELSIIESNSFKKSSRILRKINMTNYYEIIYIRINEDEDGIVNNYHIFLTGPGEKPEKIYTFNKFHFVVKFIDEVTEQTQLKCLDWTDLDFDKESDFENYYIKNQP